MKYSKILCGVVTSRNMVHNSLGVETFDYGDDNNKHWHSPFSNVQEAVDMLKLMAKELGYEQLRVYEERMIGEINFPKIVNVESK